MGGAVHPHITSAESADCHETIQFVHKQVKRRIQAYHAHTYIQCAVNFIYIYVCTVCRRISSGVQLRMYVSHSKPEYQTHPTFSFEQIAFDNS